jgi:hypothetical protein
VVATPSATIEIVAERRGLMIVVPRMIVSISIDGTLGRQRVGTHSFAVTPGSHEVAVGMGMDFRSKAKATVVVEVNETIRLRYRVGIFRGKLEIELPVARVHR